MPGSETVPEISRLARSAPTVVSLAGEVMVAMTLEVAGNWGLGLVDLSEHDSHMLATARINRNVTTLFFSVLAGNIGVPFP